MKFILVFEFIALLIAAVASYSSPDELIDYINSNQTLWRAGRTFYRNKRSVSKPLLDIKEPNENATFNDYYWKHDEYNYISKHKNLPVSFDAREKWTNCSSLNHIRDQESCRSGWAVAAVSAMSDRLCIQSKGRVKVYFSELDVISCCMYCGTPCAGGILKNAWIYGAKSGIVSGESMGCKPYLIPRCEYGATPTCIHKRLNLVCQKRCQNGFRKPYRKDKKKLRRVYTLKSVQAIMFDIYRTGPVTTRLAVHEDFHQYHSGIYQFVTGRLLGFEAVKLLGWGEKNGVKYWLAANSWGTNWGDKGFFKIIRGVNHLGIETEAYAGIFGKELL